MQQTAKSELAMRTASVAIDDRKCKLDRVEKLVIQILCLVRASPIMMSERSKPRCPPRQMG